MLGLLAGQRSRFGASVRRLQQLTHLRCRNGTAEQVALRLGHGAVSADQFKLFVGLDAFDHDGHSQIGGKPCHATQQRQRAVGIDALQEGPVDLDLLQREIVQIAQARIAGAEIVDRQAHAHRRDLVKARMGLLDIVHQRAFGDFQFEQARRLAGIGISEVEIERFPGRINVLVSCVRPGLIIGRQGQGIEELRQKLQMLVFGGNAKKKGGADLKVEVREIASPWASAAYIGQSVASQIEKRMPYLKVTKQSIEKAMTSREVEGVRIQLSGRLNGVEIARTAWLAKGRLPRQTIRADIDYAITEAHCTYGVIGIKVWVYKGEKQK